MGKSLCGLPHLLKTRCRPIKTHTQRTFFGDVASVVEARMGKIPFSGRYHCQRRLTDDYNMLQRVLGTGCNGKVHMATNMLQPGQKCAVKSFEIREVQPQMRGQLYAEVENYLSMDHPHITRLYDVYESEDQLHLVMECMEGGELFDRVKEKKRFSEEEAKDALRQMLLAVNYIHSHGIVHRDLKLENFVYDKKDGQHLKLIDFGFSKMWEPNGMEKMKSALGTISYVAPEVLNKSYTNQCDLWSLGVIGFILLAGYMPFSGSQSTMVENIRKGQFTMKPEIWGTISAEATNFIMSLLEVDPSKRLTAQQALQHPWMSSNNVAVREEVSVGVLDALRQFSQASKFRRCCMEVLAWSLTNDERSQVRDYFLSYDASHRGAITLKDFKRIMMDKLRVPDEHEAVQIFQALDYNHDQEIHYSDFLAAMVSTQIDLNDDLLKSAFRRFDAESSGYITLDNLRDILGSQVEGESVETFMQDVDENNDGRISFSEFAAYLKEGKAPVQKPPSLRASLSSRTSNVGGIGGQSQQLGASNKSSHPLEYFMSCLVAHFA